MEFQLPNPLQFAPTEEELISYFLKNEILNIPTQYPGADDEGNVRISFREVSGNEKPKKYRFPVYSSKKPGVVIGNYRVVRPSNPGETKFEYRIDPRGHPEVQGLGWESLVLIVTRSNNVPWV